MAKGVIKDNNVHESQEIRAKHFQQIQRLEYFMFYKAMP